jgi:hypothetical protein
MYIYPRSLERLILQLPLSLLKTIPPCILELLMSVLAPLVTSPKLKLRLKRVIPQMIG